MYVGASVETRVLNTTSAIAFWVTSHRRREEWARVKQGQDGGNELWRLVKHLPAFEPWVGDGKVFSRRLWWDYDQLRHDPSHEMDYGLMNGFTLAARLMLVAVLLDKVAGSTVASECVARHYWQVGDKLKELLADSDRCAVPTRR